MLQISIVDVGGWESISSVLAKSIVNAGATLAIKKGIDRWDL